MSRRISYPDAMLYAIARYWRGTVRFFAQRRHASSRGSAARWAIVVARVDVGGVESESMCLHTPISATTCSSAPTCIDSIIVHKTDSLPAVSMKLWHCRCRPRIVVVWSHVVPSYLGCDRFRSRRFFSRPHAATASYPMEGGRSDVLCGRADEPERLQVPVCIRRRGEERSNRGCSSRANDLT